MDDLQAEKVESGYQILNIVMTESLFSRIPNINFGDKDISTSVTVEVKNNTNEELIIVEVVATLAVVCRDEKLASASTRMVGTFKAIGTPQLAREDFANVNAPAIIYPFIREHISGISLKGGLGQFLIPPLNFVRKRQEETERKM